MFRESNPVTWLLVLAVAALGFYGFYVVPLYLDNLEVREAVDECFNTWVVDGEAKARGKLFRRLNDTGLGWHYEVDDEGVEEIKPGLGLVDDDVTIDFDDQERVLTVRVAYTRTVQFKPLEKRKTFPFSAQKSAGIKR